MSERMTPAAALRAIADNLDNDLVAMAGLEVSIEGGPWAKPVINDGAFKVFSIVGLSVMVRRKPVLTPAQKAGWKVGDVGRVIGSGSSNGRLVTFHKDDGSKIPYWKFVDNGSTNMQGLDRVERLIPESECKGHD